MSSFTSGLIVGAIVTTTILILYFWHREVENLKYFRHEILRETLNNERLRDALKMSLDADATERERLSNVYKQLIEKKEIHHE